MCCGSCVEVCTTPVTVTPQTSIGKIVDLMYDPNLAILPLVEGKKLVGIISKKKT